MFLRRRKKTNPWKGFAAGLVGGLAASYVMDQFQAVASKKLPKQGGQNESATEKLADRIAKGLLHRPLKPQQRKWAGTLVHYAYGALAGGLYGTLAERRTPLAAAAGVPYGTALWLITDEVAVPALHLSKAPTKYPVSNHALALASHAVYGATTDVVRRLVRRAI